MVQNMWGRVILIVIEFGIIASIFNDEEKK
jgi:hypothetical protein